MFSCTCGGQCKEGWNRATAYLMLRLSRSHTIPIYEHSMRENCHLKQEGAVRMIVKKQMFFVFYYSADCSILLCFNAFYSKIFFPSGIVLVYEVEVFINCFTAWIFNKTKRCFVLNSFRNFKKYMNWSLCPIYGMMHCLVNYLVHYLVHYHE